jgi:hypothetical protein
MIWDTITPATETTSTKPVLRMDAVVPMPLVPDEAVEVVKALAAVLHRYGTTPEPVDIGARMERQGKVGEAARALSALAECVGTGEVALSTLAEASRALQKGLAAFPTDEPSSLEVLTEVATCLSMVEAARRDAEWAYLNHQRCAGAEGHGDE